MASTGKKAAVQTVVCPVDRLPDDFYSKKRGANMGFTSSCSSKMSSNKKARFSSSPPSSSSSSATASTKEELRTMMKSIQEFNAESQFGKDRRKYHQDRLTALGAPPLTQQTMPLKMKLAILESRKKKEKGRAVVEKASGVVTADTLKKIRARKASRQGRK
eukprot:gene2795-3049_t